jgi:hypothetical protein
MNCKIINQHKNDMCHVQSLEKDFYLDILGSHELCFHSYELSKIFNFKTNT